MGKFYFFWGFDTDGVLNVSIQRSAVSGQWSAVSRQPSAVSRQPSALWHRLLVCGTGFGLGLWPRYANGHAVRTTL
ncbi:MAG: hypothetical protein F6K56_41760 [Moorea sp. SIO3G5]|nr:hypothetical protein [Moorena sp. SIO3G5]